LRSLLKYSFRFIAILSASLLFLEVFLRLTGVAQPLWTEINPNKGKLFSLNENFAFYNEGFSLTNSDKRGLTSFLSDQEDSKTFTFYGDSYTEAHQVFKRHHFLNHIRDSLGRFNCINLSMSGFDFTDNYARYLLFDTALNSSHAFFFLSDDDFDQDDTDPFIPTLKLVEDNLELKVLNEQALNSPQVKWLLPMIQNSALLYLIRNAFRQVEQGNTSDILFDGLFTFNEKEEKKDLSTEISPVVIKILRNWDRRNCTIIYRGKRPISKEYKNLLQAYQIPLIDLEAALRRTYKGDVSELYYHKGTNQSGHWNVKAHVLIGKILTDKFARRFRP